MWVYFCAYGNEEKILYLAVECWRSFGKRGRYIIGLSNLLSIVKLVC